MCSNFVQPGGVTYGAKHASYGDDSLGRRSEENPRNILLFFSMSIVLRRLGVADPSLRHQTEHSPLWADGGNTIQAAETGAFSAGPRSRLYHQAAEECVRDSGSFRVSRRSGWR